MRILNEALLETFRGHGRCESCGQLTTYREAAHIHGKGMGGYRRLDHAWNLVSLCKRCHTRHHAGLGPTRETLECVVAIRERKSWEEIHDELQRLLSRVTDPGPRKPKKRRARK